MYVQWLWCRDGKRRLFQAEPVDLADLPAGVIGWVPGRAVIKGWERVALAPIGQVSRGKAEAARRVMILHSCPEYQQLRDAALGDP